MTDLAERIKRWSEDDSAGYDQAIELLCEAEAEVSRVTEENRRLGEAIEMWRARADAVIEDVNNGNAPVHEADTARHWLDVVVDLEAARQTRRR